MPSRPSYDSAERGAARIEHRAPTFPLSRPEEAASRVPPGRPTSPPGTLNPVQIAWLDVLRGVSAQLVIMEHISDAVFPGSLIGRLDFAHLGVAVFFLLSGFLITHTVLARAAAERFTLREFMISRLARIYAPLVPALLLVAALDALMLGSPHYLWRADYTLPTFLANLAMLQDFPLFQVLRRLGVPEQPWFINAFGSVRPIWTISIEWWIYVTVGLVAFALITQRWPWWLLPALAFAAIEPAYHAIGGPGNGLTMIWLFGALLAAGFRTPLLRERLAPRSRRGQGLLALAAIALALLAAGRLVYNEGRVYDLIFLMLLTCVMFAPVLGALRDGARAPGWMRLLGALAFHSYSLYLTHLTLVTLALATLSGRIPDGWLVLVMFLGANIFAMGFARVFEVPHAALRRALLRRLGPG